MHSSGGLGRNPRLLRLPGASAGLRLGRARHRHLHRAARALHALAVGLYQAGRPMPPRSPPSIFPRSNGPIFSADRRTSFSCTTRPACGSPCKITARTPAVIRGWLVEFVAQEPRGRKPGLRRVEADSHQRDPGARTSCFPRRWSSDRKSPRRSSSWATSLYDDVFRHSHTTRFCVGVARDGKAAYAGHPAWNGYD